MRIGVPGAAGLARGGVLLAACAIAVVALAALAESRPTPEIRAWPCPERLDPRFPECADPWRNPAWIRKHFERAMDAVEWACDAKYRDRPHVVTGDKAEVAWAIARNDILERQRRPSEELRAPDHYKRRVEDLIGIYLYDLDAVYISPTGMEQSSLREGAEGLMDPGVLQLALVHEAVHALDWERFPNIEREYQDREGWALTALSAVVEGHAQHITRRVAMEWGMDAEWRTMLRLWHDAPEPDSEWQRLRGWEYMSFKYVRGQRFMDGVHSAMGHEGLRSTLARPPRYPEALFHVDAWLRILEARDDDPPDPADAPTEAEPASEFLVPPP